MYRISYKFCSKVGKYPIIERKEYVYEDGYEALRALDRLSHNSKVMDAKITIIKVQFAKNIIE